ncbi:MAG: hypothetical protein H0Z24_09470 [Thermosipho sp. (in: Bacteria)]|nr:hypothetical protein [Thermosipho sp. (in: thermotogales)]
MKVRYLREAYLAQLKSNILSNIELYKQDEPWISHYFKETSFFLETNISVDEIELIEPQGPDQLYDLENTRIIYDAFKHLNISQAIDERLWTYLTHEIFWKYMRVRWPVENKSNPDRFIRERYFFMSNRDRALIRNGISRLWWYGYITYDGSRSNPYELTKILLKKQEIAQNLLENSFSRNQMITKTILSVLADMENMNKPLPRREQFRELMRYINWLGGVTLLDALNENDIEQIIVKKLEKSV